jgi:DNA processing protein
VGKPYPPNHAPWVRELMAGRGTVFSEVPPDYTANQDSFVLRNRIVAGLADFVVAVSGKYASGTSHTVRFASDAGIQVISADPTANSGITKLVEELGGHAATVQEIRDMLRAEDL